VLSQTFLDLTNFIQKRVDLLYTWVAFIRYNTKIYQHLQGQISLIRFTIKGIPYYSHRSKLIITSLVRFRLDTHVLDMF
jgi:hypothetical protein